MNAVLGQYHYAPHRNYYGVWVWTYVGKDSATGEFIKDFDSREEARQFVWKMNGWGRPKTALAR